jgi:hypothetical protein
MPFPILAGHAERSVAELLILLAWRLDSLQERSPTDQEADELWSLLEAIQLRRELDSLSMLLLVEVSPCSQ